jgi:hypothetical protein
MTTQEIAVIESKVLSLKERAEAIQVTDQPSYVEACQIVKAGRAEIKAIGFVLDPGIGSAKEHLDKLKSDKQKFVAQVEPVVKMAETKAETWVRQEREAAAREQARLQEQQRLEQQRIADEERKAREKEIEAQRKAGEIGKRESERLKKEAEKVAAETAAAVPVVEVKAAVPAVAGVRRLTLWKFRVTNSALVPLTYRKVDEVAIGQMVRDTKDKAAAEKLCPGIEVFTEDSI